MGFLFGFFAGLNIADGRNEVAFAANGRCSQIQFHPMPAGHAGPGPATRKVGVLQSGPFGYILAPGLK